MNRENTMRHIAMMVCGCLALAGCNDKAGDPKNADIVASTRMAELQNVQATVLQSCNVRVTTEYVATVAGPSPVNVAAVAKQICDKPPQ